MGSVLDHDSEIRCSCEGRDDGDGRQADWFGLSLDEGDWEDSNGSTLHMEDSPQLWAFLERQEGRRHPGRWEVHDPAFDRSKHIVRGIAVSSR